jgi:hydroxylamine reductase
LTWRSGQRTGGAACTAGGVCGKKAVCILLTLLALDIKNIYIGPSLPAFVSSNILNALVEKFALTLISTPEADLKKILG